MFSRSSQLRVGLLGGSFNPAHEGHLHISLEALKHLRLDQVWWLVSPQNPLKSPTGMAPLSTRLAYAKGLARHPKLKVTSLEAELGTIYSIDTVIELKKRFPSTQFVWLMGADNLIQMPHWRQWRLFMRQIAIAVFDRVPYTYGALYGKAAARFHFFKRPAHRLLSGPLPGWSYLRIRPHPASATAIRNQEEIRTRPVPSRPKSRRIS